MTLPLPTTPSPAGTTGPVAAPQTDVCATVSSEAKTVKAPVDVIVVVDNSGSMRQEIEAVERNINVNLADIIGQSGIDYRVILVSMHGGGRAPICIAQPLSGNATCNPRPPMPVNGERFFHYSVEVDSNNSFTKILGSYAAPDQFGLAPKGWSAWLRPEAKKVFLELTDDEATDMPWQTFDARLRNLAPQMFGTEAARNYVFHSIVGVKENAPATAAWKPEDPIQSGKCTGNGGAVEAPGVNYQELSRVTGGLRFPLCEYTSYDVVFRAIAGEVVTGALQCAFPIPAPPAGNQLDLTRVAVSYKPGNGAAARTFDRQVASGQLCDRGDFYAHQGQIALCPQVCQTLKQDPGAAVNVLFTCQRTLIE